MEGRRKTVCNCGGANIGVVGIERLDERLTCLTTTNAGSFLNEGDGLGIWRGGDVPFYHRERCLVRLAKGKDLVARRMDPSEDVIIDNHVDRIALKDLGVV